LIGERIRRKDLMGTVPAGSGVSDEENPVSVKSLIPNNKREQKQKAKETKS